MQVSVKENDIILSSSAYIYTNIYHRHNIFSSAYIYIFVVHILEHRSVGALASTILIPTMWNDLSNLAAVEVEGWISDFILQFTVHVITYAGIKINPY